MITREDVESYLLRAGLDFEEMDEGMWSVPVSEDGKRMVVHYSPPLLLLQVTVAPVPGEARPELYRTLLELNATDMVRGAYGIEGDDIILSDALELDRLDFGQLQNAVDSIQLAVASHRERIAPLARS